MLSVSKIDCEKNVDLKKLCSIKVGGTAKKVFFPKDIQDILTIYNESKERDRKLILIGLGSNVIFRDGILEYMFVSMRKLKGINIWEKGDNVYIKASAGVSFKEIIKIVKDMNLGGFENLAGIPATVGGAVTMNAGAFGKEISDLVESVEWIDGNGEIVESSKDEISFEYRYSQFQRDGIVVSTVFRLYKADYDVGEKIKNIILERNKKQPLDLPTSGSTYKNQENLPAGYLLEKAGLKGYRVGEIGFSEKHANFLVNYGNAKFSDLIKLLQYAESKVKEEYNITLEREVRIID